MQQHLIRYRTKPDQAAANEELIRAVYEELRNAQPDGLSYATFKLADQVTFIHLAATNRNGMPMPTPYTNASSAPRRRGRRAPARAE